MRILVISNYYPPAYQGGYELSCKETVDFLLQKGHEVFILTGIYQEKQPITHYNGMQCGVPLRILQYIDYSNGGFIDKHKVERFNYRITYQVVKDVRPDIAFVWNQKGVSVGPVIALQKLHQKRMFYIGDFWPYSYRNPGFGSGFKRFIKKLLPFTVGGELLIDPVIVVSNWMKDEIVTVLHSKRVFVIPEGVKASEAISHDYGFHPLRFLFSGRIEPKKGLDYAIRALALCKTNNPAFDFLFDVFGFEEDSAYFNRCKQLTKELGIDSYVIFKGNTDQIEREYEQHHVLLMPTLSREAFGKVIIEAMTKGMLIVTTNRYGPGEIITSGEDGFSCDPTDTENLANILLKIYDSPDIIDSMGEAARQKVWTNYEFVSIKERIEQTLINEVKA